MATNIFEVPDKYLDSLICSIIYFIQKRQFCVFFQILHEICVFHYLLKSVARECVTTVTNHTEKLAQVSESRIDGLSIDTKHSYHKII